MMGEIEKSAWNDNEWRWCPAEGRADTNKIAQYNFGSNMDNSDETSYSTPSLARGTESPRSVARLYPSPVVGVEDNDDNMLCSIEVNLNLPASHSIPTIRTAAAHSPSCRVRVYCPRGGGHATV